MSDERAARYSDLFGPQRADVPDCAYCPLCSAIALVRDARPEVLEHLAAAARELAAAASVLLEEAERVVGGSHDGAGAGASATVRRVDDGGPLS